ncbi:hypothetical protein J4573_00190 [Actinomadura barringtoniae]|uniref:DUF1453 domain-containing protein n=1 Tax=Actinomadura barringtoniae TaxID=1427535 RepID=A0A939P5S3_9ACTN|nr:hypothetical protein [Actinomadura barringtoniae]MBO2445500.1 hypothetical protein [Actinomadura barringtoniae]
MTTALLVAAGVVFVIGRRFLGEPLVAKDVFVIPLVILGAAVYNLTKVPHWNAVDIGILAIGVVVGVAFGAWRGTSTVLEPRDGVLYQRYKIRTVLIWAGSLAAGGVITLTGHGLGMHEDTRPIMLSIGLGMLGETLTLGARALASGHSFAPAKDGSPTPSSLNQVLDALTARAPGRPLDHSPTFGESVRRLRGEPTSTRER